MGIATPVTLAVVCAILTLGSCNDSAKVLEDLELHRLYQEALLKYGDKSDLLRSHSVESQKQHFLAFKNTKLLVDRINNDDSLPYQSEINMFSLMTAEERQLWTGLNVTNSIYKVGVSDGPLMSVASTPPPSADHSQSGQVPVKHQDKCGSCWAFATNSMIEFAYYATTGDLVSFSEQELLDCSYPGDIGCGGGWYDAPLKYLQENKRLSCAADNTYKGKKSPSCSGSRYPNKMTKARVVRWSHAEGPDFRLKEWASKGVVAVAIEVLQSFFTYKSGIYKEANCNRQVGHAVTVVGYGEKDGMKFWKVRNSWGRRWGDQGYILMSRDQHNICLISTYIISATLECTGNCNPPDFDSDDGNDDNNDNDDENYDYNDDEDGNDDDNDNDGSDGWKPIKRKEALPVNLGETPLQIKTCENAGEMVKLHFYDEDMFIAGTIYMELSGTSATVSGFGISKEKVIHDLPWSKTKIWQISRCKAGLTKIKCNGKLVLTIDPNKCIECPAERFVWKKMDVKYFMIPDCDTATKAYRSCDSYDLHDALDVATTQQKNEISKFLMDTASQPDKTVSFVDSSEKLCYKWKKPADHKPLPICLTKTPVEVKTCEKKGNVASFKFLDENKACAGSLKIRFRSSYVQYSGKGFTDTKKFSNIPSEKTKVWQIIRDSGITIIKCNGKEVATIDPYMDSNIQSWAKKSWMKNKVKYIEFRHEDTATKLFRNSPHDDDSHSHDDELDEDHDDGQEDDGNEELCYRWKKPDPDVLRPICLKKTPVEVKTCEKMGRMAKFKFFDENKDSAGSLKILFAGDCVKYSGDGFIDTKRFPSLPSTETKVWQISRKSGITTIECNGKEVATIDPFSDSNIVGAAKNAWKKNSVKYIKFCQYDEATKEFRNVPEDDENKYDDGNDNDNNEDGNEDGKLCYKWKKPMVDDAIPICLKKTPVEVKTCEYMGKVANFKFLDENKDCAGSLKIIFSESCVKYTGKGFIETKRFPTLPSSQTKVWQISRDYGITTITCNGKKVAEIDPDNDSNIMKYAKSSWRKNSVKFIMFGEYDESTKAVRNVPDGEGTDDGNDESGGETLCTKWKKPVSSDPLRVCLMKTPVELKTCQYMGNLASFLFLDENKNCAGSLKIIFDGDCTKYTGKGFTKKQKFPTLPSSQTKMWQISRDNGVTTIKCNGIKVAEIDPDNDSNIEHSSKSSWRKNVKFIRICQLDEATKAYRNAPESDGNSYDDQSNDGGSTLCTRWKTPAVDEPIPICLSTTPVEIRTCEKKGRMARFRFLDGNKQDAGSLTLLFTRNPLYFGDGFILPVKFDSLPETETRLWRITRSGGVTKISCNGEEVARIDPDSDSNIRDSLKGIWMKSDVKYIVFSKEDKATKQFRNAPN